MILTLLRHTQVHEDFVGKYNGHNNIPLSPQGKKDAKKIAKKLQKGKFDAVFCSDLLRCRQTVAPLSEMLTPLEIHYTPALREKSWGEYEGMSFEEIEASGIKYKNFSQWIEALGGESIEDFVKRVEDFFTFHILNQNHEHTLVVTHSGVIKTFIAWQKNISLEEAFSHPLPYGDFIVFNTNTQTFSDGKYNFG